MVTDILAALRDGLKIRRPGWPEGDYVEAAGAGASRVVSPGTMRYYKAGVLVGDWCFQVDYLADFAATDFEELA